MGLLDNYKVKVEAAAAVAVGEAAAKNPALEPAELERVADWIPKLVFFGILLPFAVVGLVLYIVAICMQCCCVKTCRKSPGSYLMIGLLTAGMTGALFYLNITF